MIIGSTITLGVFLRNIAKKQSNRDTDVYERGDNRFGLPPRNDYLSD
jgi:hypothetical protein